MSRTLKTSIVIGGAISGSFRSALSSTKSGLKAIGEAIADVERRQRLMSRSIGEFGRMGKDVGRMRQEYASLTRETDKLRAAQSRLASVQERIDANNDRRRHLRGELGSAAATFGVVAAATLAPVRSAVNFETAMLGVAKQLEGARDEAGNLTPVFFSMSRQVQQLGREIPLATNELADMVAAGLRMGVASDEVVEFTRTAAMMADAFELPAGQLADDMGKIAGLFHIPIPRIGELADAINFLDDRSQATGSEIIDVLRRTGGMAQALKMPAREAAALGSTFLTLGSSAEVAGTASNAMMRILGAATAQSKRVQVGMSSIGLDPKRLQSDMAKDATGTILRLLDTLNALNDEQRMVAATRIFGAEYGDDVAKLATGANEYRRQLQLVNGEQANGSMSREFAARLGTTAAQWQITKNRLREVSVVIGNALVPSISRLMEAAAPMIEGFADWSRANPGLIRGIVGSALALSGLRVVTTGVAYAWTAVKGPVLSVMGFIARFRATGALAAMGRFGPAAMRAAGALRLVGGAIAAISGGPVTLAIGALTAGALVVRKYWQPIKAFMSGMFDGVREAMAPVLSELGAAIAPLKPVWDAMSVSIGKAWNWIVKLLEPVNMTSGELSAATNAGRVFGHAISGAAVGAIRVLTQVVRVAVSIGSAIGTATGAIVGAFSSAWDRVKGIVGSAVDWIMKRIRPVLMASTLVGGAISGVANAVGLVGDSVAPPATTVAPATAGPSAAPRASSAPSVTVVAGAPGMPGKAGAPGLPGAAAKPAAPGEPGKPGLPGAAAKPGIPGVPGLPGKSGAPGLPGAAAKQAAAPAPGVPGKPGEPGKAAPAVNVAPVRGRTAPPIAAAANPARPTVTVTDQSQHHYNITQQPGESGEDLARRFEAERRRQDAINQRGRLVDGAG
ncbi:phage tail tape measure protein [Pseudoxanthomonas sp. LjRoot143]|uniref:phage tail tape measure protein n=1 Tax=Pseudoxanthomonas sp. LjRoot143 TaxID=3342266 RepID=UPI003ECC44D1